MASSVSCLTPLKYELIAPLSLSSIPVLNSFNAAWNVLFNESNSAFVINAAPSLSDTTAAKLFNAPKVIITNILVNFFKSLDIRINLPTYCLFNKKSIFIFINYTQISYFRIQTSCISIFWTNHKPHTFIRFDWYGYFIFCITCCWFP